MWYSAKHKINNQQLTDEQIVFTKHAKGNSKTFSFPGGYRNKPGKNRNAPPIKDADFYQLICTDALDPDLFLGNKPTNQPTFSDKTDHG